MPARPAQYVCTTHPDVLSGASAGLARARTCEIVMGEGVRAQDVHVTKADHPVPSAIDTRHTHGIKRKEAGGWTDPSSSTA